MKRIRYALLFTICWILFCFSQELPYSLLLEAKGGTDIAGLIPDPIVDPIIHPALLDISNPAIYLGGRLESNYVIPYKYKISPFNYGHVYFYFPIKDWNVGITFNEKMTYYDYQFNYYTYYRRYRTGYFVLNKSILSKIQFGLCLGMENYSKYEQNFIYTDKTKSLEELYFKYNLYKIGTSINYKINENLSLSGSYFQNYKNLDIHSKFSAENNIDRYPIFNFTVNFKKADLYVIRLFYSYSTEQTYSCLSSSNYEYYQNKNDKQFEFGIGSMFRLFPFVKGYIAADYLQNKYLYKADYYSVQLMDVFSKVFFGCEVALTEYLKAILGEYFYWSDYYTSHDSEAYERWYSVHGLSAHRVGMELKINNHLKGFLYFRISEYFYLNEGTNFQFVYTF